MDSILVLRDTEEHSGFWQRQLSASGTAPQLAFDILFGILMPLLCFYLDPGILNGGFRTAVSEASIFIYAFSAIAIFTLAIWLVFGYRLRATRAIFGGVLLAGSVCSFSIGIMILPLTLLGILFLIGLLGFVPFLTGFVYFRNGWRAVRQNNSGAERASRFSIVVLSALVAVAIPALGQWKATNIVKQSMGEILNQDAGPSDSAVRRIKQLRWIVDTDQIVREYQKEVTGARKERLAKAYKDITGTEIEDRLRRLND